MASGSFIYRITEPEDAETELPPQVTITEDKVLVDVLMRSGFAEGIVVEIAHVTGWRPYELPAGKGTT